VIGQKHFIDWYYQAETLTDVRITVFLSKTIFCPLTYMGEDILKQLSKLSIEEQNLLATYLRGQNKPKIQSETEHFFQVKEYPMSMGQERMWFSEKLDDRQSVYNNPLVLIFKGGLETDIFRQSLQILMNRHEVLRTVYVTDQEGNPFQRIEDTFEFPLTFEDRRGTEMEILLSEIEEKANQPFDLERSVVRATLYRTNDSEHLFFATIHHIAGDGWSINVFRRELIENYNRLCRGEKPVDKKLKIQYGDYAVWQRQQWSVKGEDKLRFWEEYLGGKHEIVELKRTGARGERLPTEGGQIELTWAEETTQNVRELGRMNGATVFMVMAALFGVVIGYRSGKKEVVIGMDVAGREAQETEELIGFFVNSVPIKIRYEEEETINELIARVKEESLRIYENQEVPFEKIVERVKPERKVNYAPIYQVKLVLQKELKAEEEMEGIRITEKRVRNAKAQYDLVVNMKEGEKEIKGVAEYAKEIMSEEETEQLMRWYEQSIKKAAETEGKIKIKQIQTQMSEEEESQKLTKLSALEKKETEKLKIVKRKPLT
jgi:Condensation domain